MNHNEIKKKDWQLLTAYSEISALSYLKTILENQAFIVASLTNRQVKDVLSEMDKAQKENYSSLSKLVKDNIPDYE